MTLFELIEVLKDKDMNVVAYDNETSEVIKTDIDNLYSATVKEIVTEGRILRVFVDNPKHKYYTYLDVTYSTRIELDVPEYGDKKELFYAKADEIIKTLPDSFCVKGYNFSYGYDNRETGGLEDMIERC